jgi:oligoribonuclease
MKKFFWIDLEMTGLDETVDHILEGAAVITSLDFEMLDQMHFIVKQPEEILKKMDPFVYQMHQK